MTKCAQAPLIMKRLAFQRVRGQGSFLIEIEYNRNALKQPYPIWIATELERESQTPAMAVTIKLKKMSRPGRGSNTWTSDWFNGKSVAIEAQTQRPWVRAPSEPTHFSQFDFHCHARRLWFSLSFLFFPALFLFYLQQNCFSSNRSFVVFIRNIYKMKNILFLKNIYKRGCLWKQQLCFDDGKAEKNDEIWCPERMLICTLIMLNSTLIIDKDAKKILDFSTFF